jgi:hypothetical protein
MPARSASDSNFLTAAHTQGRINVDARIINLAVLLLDLSVTTHCGASKSNAPIHNLITYHQICCIDKVSDQDLEQICPL